MIDAFEVLHVKISTICMFIANFKAEEAIIPTGSIAVAIQETMQELRICHFRIYVQPERI